MSFNKINFDRAIEKIRDNLQYLSDKGVSQKFIVMQNLILQSLMRYSEETELYISQLEMDNFQLSKKIGLDFQKFNASKEAFEAICLIHGINDFLEWLAKGRSYLVQLAIEFHNENTMQLPFKLIEMINEMNDNDRGALIKLLMKK